MTVTEIRVEVDPSEVSVLDGYCSATGKNRSVRGLLKDWSNAKLHEATLILRVAGINPTQPEGERK